MKAEEKQIIYNLLKTADAHNLGYTREVFANERTFEDDKIDDKSLENENSTTNLSEISTPQINESSTETKNGITLETISSKIARCTRCSLARTRHNVMSGFGVKNPEVLVICTSPNFDEDMQGKCFAGKSGILTEKMLTAIKLDYKTNCYITNVVKCYPPENRTPFPDEQSACFSFLEAQIHILKPKMILCMGQIAIEKLLDENVNLAQNHGNFYEYTQIPVLPTFDANDLLKDENLKKYAWDDLKKFRIKLNEILQF